MEMSWLPMNDNYQLINSAHLGGYGYDDYFYEKNYIFGIDQEYIISPHHTALSVKSQEVFIFFIIA